MNRIYTIGYYSYSIEEFIDVLKQYKINAVADVRTLPYSQHNADFSKELFSRKLNNNRIYYVPLGKECGARPCDMSCYVDDRVDFEILSKKEIFCHGIQRLRNGMEKCTIAIMCAEQDPLNCHRYILVAHELLNRYPDIELFNILPHGNIEEAKSTDLRLMHLYDLDIEEFSGVGKSFDERRKEAFLRQSRKISFHKDATSTEVL